jgi:hypothetical protein
MLYRNCFFCLEASLAGDPPAQTPEAEDEIELAALCESMGWGIDDTTAPPTLKFYCPACKLITDPPIAQNIRVPPPAPEPAPPPDE